MLIVETVDCRTCCYALDYNKTINILLILVTVYLKKHLIGIFLNLFYKSIIFKFKYSSKILS